jgi:pimeloyl-ACP methyl ester carboxylesterase
MGLWIGDNSMATFILVHGSLHGGWCWEKVVHRLNEAGHRAFAPDLPGMGADRTPPLDVTLATTGGFIAELAQRQPEKVILVGHSLGGITISDAAERAPEVIAGLVYVTAVLLPDGATAMGVVMSSGHLPTGISLSSDGATLTIDPDCARERYYNGCDEGDTQNALARLVPQPTRPMRDRLIITSGRFGMIPRAYVECLHDKAIPPDFQRSQYEAMPCHPIFTMETGHSPFMQASEELSAHLIAAAAAFGLRRGPDGSLSRG